MTDETIEDRLQKYTEKRENGEPLSDEELEQLREDIETMSEAMGSIAEAISSAYTALLNDVTRETSPLLALAEEYEKECDNE